MNTGERQRGYRVTCSKPDYAGVRKFNLPSLGIKRRCSTAIWMSAPTAGAGGRGLRLQRWYAALTWAGRVLERSSVAGDWLQRHSSVQLLMPELATVVKPIEVWQAYRAASAGTH